MGHNDFPRFICVDGNDEIGCHKGEEVFLTDPYADDYSVEIMIQGKTKTISEHDFRTHFKEKQSYDWNQYLAVDNRESRFFLTRLISYEDDSDEWYAIFKVKNYDERYIYTVFEATCSLNGKSYTIEMGMEESRFNEMVKRKMIILPVASPFMKENRAELGNVI